MEPTDTHLTDAEGTKRYGLLSLIARALGALRTHARVPSGPAYALVNTLFLMLGALLAILFTYNAIQSAPTAWASLRQELTQHHPTARLTTTFDSLSAATSPITTLASPLGAFTYNGGQLRTSTPTSTFQLQIIDLHAPSADGRLTALLQLTLPSGWRSTLTSLPPDNPFLKLHISSSTVHSNYEYECSANLASMRNSSDSPTLQGNDCKPESAYIPKGSDSFVVKLDLPVETHQQEYHNDFYQANVTVKVTIPTSGIGLSHLHSARTIRPSPLPGFSLRANDISTTTMVPGLELVASVDNSPEQTSIIEEFVQPTAGAGLSTRITRTNLTQPSTPDTLSTDLTLILRRANGPRSFVYMIALVPYMLALIFAHMLFFSRSTQKRELREVLLALAAIVLAILPLRAVLVPNDIGAFTAVDILLALPVAGLVVLAVIKYLTEVWPKREKSA